VEGKEEEGEEAAGVEKRRAWGGVGRGGGSGVEGKVGEGVGMRRGGRERGGGAYQKREGGRGRWWEALQTKRRGKDVSGGAGEGNGEKEGDADGDQGRGRKGYANSEVKGELVWVKVGGVRECGKRKRGSQRCW